MAAMRASVGIQQSTRPSRKGVLLDATTASPFLARVAAKRQGEASIGILSRFGLNH
jgi:hypothetical protein